MVPRQVTSEGWTVDSVCDAMINVSSEFVNGG